ALRGASLPAVRGFEIVDARLARDLAADRLFASPRLPGAPDPVVRTDTSSDESNDYYWRLSRSAERARREGDQVRAAVLITKAARVAPAALTLHSRDQARHDQIGRAHV